MFNTVVSIVARIVIVIVAVVMFLYLFMKFYPGIGMVPSNSRRKYYAKKNSLYYDGKFHNIEKASINMLSYEDKEAKNIKPKSDIKILKIDKIKDLAKDKISITWLGHSSILIQIDGKNILTDPALTKYASPFGFIGVKRFNDSPISLEDMPDIDVVLISHDHYDHLDYKTIKKIDSKVKKYIVPLGVESYLLGWKVNKEKIVVLDWWDDEKIDEVVFTAVPAKHFSMRNPMSRDATLWCGFLIRCNDKKIYFTGDTGYSSTFREVYDRFGDIDIFMADTGQYNKAWSGVHMNPHDALQAAKDVNARYYIPIHWGAFSLSNHDWFEPAKITTSNQEKYGVRVITPRIGEIVDVDYIEKYTDKWWEEN